MAHLRTRLCLVAMLVACSAPPTPHTTPPATGAAPGAATVSAPITGDRIERGRPIEKTLAPGDAHRYHTEVAVGHVLVATVDQRGVDVVVSTFDPTGKRLAEIDSPNGQIGPEPVVIEATQTGVYAIEVRSFAAPPTDPTAASTPASSATAKYEIRIDDLLTADEYVERQLKERIDSPRMLELWRSLRNRGDAETAFWAERNGKGPIVEPYANDPASALVTFVFRSKSPYVGMFGGPTAREQALTRLPKTDTWFLSARMPRTSRADYAFFVTDDPPDFHVPWKKEGTASNRWNKKQLDPTNPNSLLGLSRLELPDAPAEPWIGKRAPSVSPRNLVELAIDSKQMHEKRNIGIYVPPGYDPKQTYPLVIAFDGEVYGLDPSSALIPLPLILDNLIAAKKIPPVVAAIVANQGMRDRDLTMSKPFADFVALELIPKLRATYHAGLTAGTTLVTGSSFGGVAAMYIGLIHSNVVGLVLSQSGAFWFRPGDLERELPEMLDEPRLPHLYATTPKLPLKIYLDAGLFESDHKNEILSMNRRMRDVLLAKGYPTRYVEFAGGHDYSLWRSTIPDALIYLLDR